MNDFCKDIEFTTAINTLATAIASKCNTLEELGLAAVVLTQIGDTLATIAVRREFCNSKNKNADE